MIKGTYKAISFKRDLTKDEVLYVRQMARKDLVPVGLPIIKIQEVHNLIPLSGKQAIAQRLAGDATLNGFPNYLAVGSGSTAFNNQSTKLNTEVFRKILTDSGNLANVTYFDTIIESGDVANQTFEEVALFIGGTASANTGTALSLAITGGFVKSGSIYISGKLTLT